MFLGGLVRMASDLQVILGLQESQTASEDTRDTLNKQVTLSFPLSVSLSVSLSLIV